MYQRRTNAVSGWVNFPINDPNLPSTKEGGMVVKLVVIDPDEEEDSFPVCCGGSVFDIQGDPQTGDDQRPRPEYNITEFTNEEWEKPEVREYSYQEMLTYQEALAEWQEYHFPNTKYEGTVYQYTSRGYLAAIVLGTTGWSSGDWYCKHEDLTPEGKALYATLQYLYPKGKIHLLTYLDT